jgi:FdhD protein
VRSSDRDLGARDRAARDDASPRDDTLGRRPVTPVRVQAVDDDRIHERPDRLVTEEPMEIRVHGPGQEPEALAVTMRTPGSDFELAAGFCRTEGIIDGAADVGSVAYCLEGTGPQHYNVVTLGLRRPVDLDGSRRRFVANASCGLCGKTALEDVVVACPPVAPGPVVPRAVLDGLPARLRDAQTLFGETGGLHAAALFEPDGTLETLREDVGRHNALDKLVGHALLEGRLPLADRLLLVSGRVSFEIVQKAAVAGIPLVCAVSAPSSLAVRAAERLGQTVIGFLRDGRFNIYCGPERIALGDA